MSRSFSRRCEVAEAMHASAIRVLRIVRMEDQRTAIGPAQLSALSVLVFLGSKSLRDLAALEQVKPPTMSRIVQSLVRGGLVERRSQSADRRSLQISTTPKGRRMLLAGRDLRVRALAKRFECLKDSDLGVIEKAARLLSKI